MEIPIDHICTDFSQSIGMPQHSSLLFLMCHGETPNEKKQIGKFCHRVGESPLQDSFVLQPVSFERQPAKSNKAKPCYIQSILDEPWIVLSGKCLAVVPEQTADKKAAKRTQRLLKCEQRQQNYLCRVQENLCFGQ